METTRHFVATVYVVCDGATALHQHDRLDMWLPPGGHIDRDELPHEAALREVREETGLDVELVAETQALESETARSLPMPQHLLLEDINVNESGEVGHQHIDFIYYGRADTRDIDPDGHDEAHPEVWEWFTAAELEANREMFAADIVEAGKAAIEAIGTRFEAD
jgi:8-oxo-dGTP pyrophosphatase MutT (NUDIX family)